MTKYLSAEMVADSFPGYDVSNILNVLGNEQMTEVIERANRKAPYICNVRELEKHGSIRISSPDTSIVLGSSASDHGIDEPSRIFFALGNAADLIAVRGTIEGRQAFGHPFVGNIETSPELLRRGLATKILPILNEVCNLVYADPLSAGPDSYLSSDGRNLRDALAQRYGLGTNQARFVHG